MKSESGTVLQPILPIRALGENQRPRIAAHLLSLNDQDRYLRFGYAIQDDQIRQYVTDLDFGRDEIFGIHDRKLSLLAVAHLAYGRKGQASNCAEFGVSVVTRARGRGYGRRLFERAAMHAKNQGIPTLYVHALTENTLMLGIARAAGARVQREGAESEAYLQLRQGTIFGRGSEYLLDQLAEADYLIKRHFKRLHTFCMSLRPTPRPATPRTTGENQ